MAAKKPTTKQKTSRPVNKTVNMETDLPLFNTFTKSYKTRYVVHASRDGDVLTICGRNIASRSKEPFDIDVPGACLKCIQRMNIEKRIHPGWVG